MGPLCIFIHLRYNIFTMANISSDGRIEEAVARLLMVIGQPVRIQILTVLEAQPACVCHLEAVTGIRQASISQHLMVLRQAGLVAPNRSGRNIYYRLMYPEAGEILELAAKIAGVSPDEMQRLAQRPYPGCPCPHCQSTADESTTCQSSRMNPDNCDDTCR